MAVGLSTTPSQPTAYFQSVLSVDGAANTVGSRATASAASEKDACMV